MLTVKVEKSEHGGYIAKQEGDTPLRYIAAAGETEAAAVSALFEYHADLIRKGRIEVSEVKTGIRPGQVIPNVGIYDPSEHGKVVTKQMWEYVLPMAYGIADKPENNKALDALICYMVKQCFSGYQLGKYLRIEGEPLKWLRVALDCRNQSPALQSMRVFKNNNDIQEGSPVLIAELSLCLCYYRYRPAKLGLNYQSSKIVDMLECLVKGSEAKSFIIDPLCAYTQVMLSLLDIECVGESKDSWKVETEYSTKHVYHSDDRLPLR